jgi:hypothetical protein
LKCTHCDTENPNNSQFCSNCGEKIDPPVEISRELNDQVSEKKVGWWKRQPKTSKILIISIPIIIILLIIATALILTSDTKTFSKNGVYFNYPANWTELQPPTRATLDTVAYVYDPENNNTVFAVRKLNSDADLNLTSLEDAVNTFKSSNQNSSSAFTLISEKPVTINGLNGHEFIYTSKAFYGLAAETKDKAVFIEKTPGKTYYLIIGETLSENYDELEPTFDKIINSFKIQ